MTDTLVKHSDRTVRRPCKKCGRNDLYWAHDTSRPEGEHCQRCNVRGRFTLIEKDGTRHTHSDVPKDDFPKSDVIPDGKGGLKVEAAKALEVVPIPHKKEETPTVTGNGDVQAALELLAGALGPKIDHDAIKKIVSEEVANTIFPTRTVVEKASGERKEIEGNQHEKLADVVMALMAGEHVMMAGPAGTGKSTIAEQAAESLSLPSYSISLSPQTPASQLVGYMQATGDYVPTLFREAYENGGVFHFDEVDNAHPSVLAVVNSALANGRMAFPDKMVSRHADFRAYVGRQAIDAATLDRFSIVTIEVDEALEASLCHSTGLETDQVKRVLTFVRKIRGKIMELKLPLVVSPRASVGMCRLLRAGYSWESAVDSRVRRGLSEAEWKKING
jgi:cobaltochelatase CobS